VIHILHVTISVYQLALRETQTGTLSDKSLICGNSDTTQNLWFFRRNVKSFEVL